MNIDIGRYREGVLDFVARLPLRFYWLFVPLFLFLAFVSVRATRNMVIKLSLFDELPPDHPQIIRYNEVAEKYGGVDTVFFVIRSSNIRSLKNCAEDIEARLRALEEIKTVRGKVPFDFLKKHALFLIDMDDLKELEDFLRRRETEFKRVFENLDFVYFVRSWSELMESEILEREEVEDEGEFVRAITNMRNWVSLIRQYIEDGNFDDEKYRSVFRKIFLLEGQAGDGYEYDPEHGYMISEDMDAIVISAIPTRPSDDYGFNSVIYQKLSEIKREVSEGSCKGQQLFLGGSYIVLEEQRGVVLSDMRNTTLLAGILGTIVFLIIFRGIGGMIIIVSAIAVGLALSFGFLMLTFGYITVVSALFGAFLIGLGVDFQAYVFSRWKEFVHEGVEPKEAMYYALKSVIPPMVVGATTTSAAFFSVVISEITGAKVLSVVAGSGIIIYLLTSIFFTSSLIILLRGLLTREKDISLDHPLRFIGNLVSRFPFPFLVIYTILILVGLGGLTKFGFEYNLRKVFPPLPAIHAEDEAVSELGRPKDYTVFVFDTLEDLDSKLDEIKKKSTVKSVESIRLIYPSDMSDKVPIVMSIHDVLYDISVGDKPNLPSVLPAERIKEAFESLKRVSSAMVELSILSGSFQGENEAKRLKEDIEVLIDVLSKKEYVDLTSLQVVNSDVVSRMLDDLKLASKSRGFTMDEIPEDIKKLFIGKDGSFMAFVYPQKVVWEDENYMRLIKNEMEEVDPRSFSVMSIFLSVTDRVKRDFAISLVIAFFAVSIIVFLFSRNPARTIFSMIPVTSSLIVTSGVASLGGIKIHYINMGAYSLLLGVGVDYGVHIVHRLIEEGDLRKAIMGTGRAILIAAITTMIGFGSMLIAHFPGLEDLGEILTIGIFFSALLSVVFIPAIFGFFAAKIGLKEQKNTEKTSMEQKASNNKDL